jgi:hypothetical protein
MLREHTSLIDQCSISNTHSEKVKSHFVQFLSIDTVRVKMTSSLEVETQGWTLKEFTLNDTVATMAYDGQNVRCLCIKIGRTKPVSVLTSDFDTVEALFNQWAEQVLGSYINSFIEGIES